MITLSFDNMLLFACRFQQHYSISVTLLLTGEHHCASHYVSMYYLSNVWQSEGGGIAFDSYACVFLSEVIPLTELRSAVIWCVTRVRQINTQLPFGCLAAECDRN